MSDCIFCKIISKEIPSEIVYEDGHTLAFLDINPATKGHTLIVSKEHYKTIFDVPENVLCEIIKVTKKISRSVVKYNGGVNIVQSNKGVAHQEVDHIHFHVIPRNENDGLVLNWESKPYMDDEAKKVAEKIKENLE